MAVIKRISSKAKPSKIVKYLTQEEKTEEKLIGGKDCNPDNVVNDFDMTQELYGKTAGVKYHHVIQSFSPEDDITPEKAHELGMELAESQFKGFEVFVVTHRDKEHIHNHLVVNSVSFETGLKYNASNKSLWDIKRESNKICEREHLQVLDLEHKADKRISSAEKRIMDRGQIPWKDELRQCIDVARERTKDLESFREFLDKNFDIETRVTKSSISYKHPDHGKAIRGRSLGERYNKEELENEFNGEERAVFRKGERYDTTKGSNESRINREDVERAVFFGHGADEISSIGNDKPVNSIEEGIRESRGQKQDLSRGIEGRWAEENPQHRILQEDRRGVTGRNKGYEGHKLQEDRGSIQNGSESAEKPQGNDKYVEQCNLSGTEDRETGLEGQSKTVCSESWNNSRNDTPNARSIPGDEIIHQIANSFKAKEKEDEKASKQVVKGHSKPKSKSKKKSKNRDWDMER